MLVCGRPRRTPAAAPVFVNCQTHTRRLFSGPSEIRQGLSVRVVQVSVPPEHPLCAGPSGGDTRHRPCLRHGVSVSKLPNLISFLLQARLFGRRGSLAKVLEHPRADGTLLCRSPHPSLFPSTRVPGLPVSRPSAQASVVPDPLPAWSVYSPGLVSGISREFPKPRLSLLRDDL